MRSNSLSATPLSIWLRSRRLTIRKVALQMIAQASAISNAISRAAVF